MERRGGVTTAGCNNTMRENDYEMKDSRKTRTGIHANTLRTYGLDKAGSSPLFNNLVSLRGTKCFAIFLIDR